MTIKTLKDIILNSDPKGVEAAMKELTTQNWFEAAIRLRTKKVLEPIQAYAKKADTIDSWVLKITPTLADLSNKNGLMSAMACTAVMPDEMTDNMATAIFLLSYCNGDGKDVDNKEAASNFFIYKHRLMDDAVRCCKL